MRISAAFLVMSICTMCLHVSWVFVSDWKKVGAPETLKAIFSDTTLGRVQESRCGVTG